MKVKRKGGYRAEKQGERIQMAGEIVTEISTCRGF